MTNYCITSFSPLRLLQHHSLILVLLYDSLSQWDESGRSVTGSTVSDWGVGDGELTQVVANHLWLNLNGVENLTVVDTNQGADHLWNNNHVSQVGLDDSWLLVSWGSQLGGSQLGDETHWLGTQASGESSSNSGAAELGELVGVHLQKLLKVNALEGEGLEGSLPGVCWVSTNFGIKIGADGRGLKAIV